MPNVVRILTIVGQILATIIASTVVLQWIGQTGYILIGTSITTVGLGLILFAELSVFGLASIKLWWVAIWALAVAVLGATWPLGPILVMWHHWPRDERASSNASDGVPRDDEAATDIETGL